MNWSRMTIMYKKDRGRSKVKLRKRWQSQDWRQEKWCYVYGGIGKESFTMSCCHLVKGLILTSTVNNWKDYAKQSKESDQNCSIRKASSSITTTPDYIFGDLSKIERTWLGSFWCIHFIVLILHQTIICFDFYRTLLMM